MMIQNSITSRHDVHLRTWLRFLFAAGLLCSLVLAIDSHRSFATDFVELNASNWDEFVPQGKEVDAIYGDYALRNDQIVVIIARPSPSRNANLTIRDVGGFVLDLTSRSDQNDQLSCYIPLGGAFHFHSTEKLSVFADEKKAEPAKATGRTIRVVLQSSRGPGQEKATLEYELTDGSAFLKINHRVTNGEKSVRNRNFSDSIRADRTFSFSTHVDGHLFCASDDWFRQSYGVLFGNGTVKRGKGNVVIDFAGQGDTTRLLFPADSQLGAIGRGRVGLEQKVTPVKFSLEDPSGGVAHSRVTLTHDGKSVGSARTDRHGNVSFLLPEGTYQASIVSLGQNPVQRSFGVLNQREVRVRVKYETNPPVVRANIRDDQGRPIPCKVAFYGINGTKDPDWGPDSAANPVKNLHYSHNGQFSQVIPPGEYEVIISHGNEYDAEFLTIKAAPGKITPIASTLKRVVDSTGWVSTDYHSHSTPSGDNTSDQRGRVLNLLAENIEFAPCTEHQRVDSYVPHLRALHAENLMATCSGMELTGSPLPLNHQNSFPLIHRPRTQDGGGPRIDPDPVVQIRRIAYWDDKSEKLVQSNHPNLIQMTGDADLNGVVDDGFKEMFEYMDVMEVHPPEKIFQKPDSLPAKGNRGNVIFNWMQLLNQGYRVYGVVNTDAHYNFHGSGWIRNYVKSSTDDPARIQTMEMVHQTEQGRVIMSTGPFMEASLEVDDSGKRYISGDTVNAPAKKATLHVKIQCANWLDVNRVQVFVNGHALKNLNFTRRTHPKMFSNDVVKFDQSIPLELNSDSHVIVATIGEGLTLGRVMGKQYGNRPPCAVSNPIFVDVDGNGFQASGDKIGSPLLIRK